jgi:hypothetical protein
MQRLHGAEREASMTEITDIGRAPVNSGFSGAEHARRAAGLPDSMSDGGPAESPATSLASALEKKHTFDCAQPTRGGLCDC